MFKGFKALFSAKGQAACGGVVQGFKGFKQFKLWLCHLELLNH